MQRTTYLTSCDAGYTGRVHVTADESHDTLPGP